MKSSIIVLIILPKAERPFCSQRQVSCTEQMGIIFTVQRKRPVLSSMEDGKHILYTIQESVEAENAQHQPLLWSEWCQPVRGQIHKIVAILLLL